MPNNAVDYNYRLWSMGQTPSLTMVGAMPPNMPPHGPRASCTEQSVPDLLPEISSTLDEANRAHRGAKRFVSTGRVILTTPLIASSLGASGDGLELYAMALFAAIALIASMILVARTGKIMDLGLKPQFEKLRHTRQAVEHRIRTSAPSAHAAASDGVRFFLLHEDIKRALRRARRTTDRPVTAFLRRMVVIGLLAVTCAGLRLAVEHDLGGIASVVAKLHLAEDDWTPREGLIAGATLALETITGAMMAFGYRAQLDRHLSRLRRLGE